MSSSVPHLHNLLLHKLLGRLLLLMLLPTGLQLLSCAGNLCSECCQLLPCCLVLQACLLRCMLHLQKCSSLQPRGTMACGKHCVLARESH